jgi:TonB-linked SusC/RagA family outer membrane protein
MNRHILIIILALLICNSYLIAQNGIVSGIVSADDGTPLPGATVLIKGTTAGETTDINGEYSLDLSGYTDPILIYRFIGFITQEVVVGNQSKIDITLVSEVQSLEEIIVVGYGVTKKSLVTGAISKISDEDLNKNNPIRFENALQGKTSGVLVQQSSGAPGAVSNILIRGAGSQNAVRPIYIIDGIRTDGMDWLDPQDIGSIEILKDAASAAIYGTEGANGVILITTKSGVKGKTTLTYDGFYGFQMAPSNFKVLDTEGYLKYYRTANINDGDDEATALNNWPDSDVNTDWLGELLVNSPMQKHKIGISGATDNNNYYFTVSYTNQDGIVGGGNYSNFKRYSTFLKSETQATKWFKAGGSINYSHIRTKGITENNVFGGEINNAMVLDPTSPIRVTDYNQISDLDRARMELAWGEEWYTHPGLYDENGYFGISERVKNEIANPFAQMHNNRAVKPTNKIIGGVFGEIKFLEGLNFRSSFDIDLSHQYERGWYPYRYYNSVQGASSKSETFQRINMYYTWQWENYLSFNKAFGDHNVGAVLGTSKREWRHEYLGGTGEEIIKESDNFGWIDYALVDTTEFNRAEGRLGGITRSQSFFGRISYDFQGKYLFTSNARIDGNSNFGPNNKYGFFPSASVGWVISKEDFWNIEPISFAKIRYSWGVNGSASSLGAWEYLPTASINDFYYLSGNESLWGVIEPSSLTNPEYRWEESVQHDVGVDLTFLQNRITFTVDYYDKKTVGLLFPGTAPDYVGNEAPTVNAGTVQNKGVELELGYNNSAGDLDYSIKLTASNNKNQVTSVGDGIEYLSGANVGTIGNTKRFEPGYDTWYFYGYATDGIFTSEEEILNHTDADNNLLQPDAVPGDVKYLDIAGPLDSLGNPTGPDGLIGDDDKINLGSPYPKWHTGLSVSLDYRGFDFYMYWYASIGNKTLNANAIRYDVTNSNKPVYYLEDAYSSDNSSGTFPRITLDDPNRNLRRINEFFVEDASFLRMSTISVGYTLPKKLTQNIGMEKLRVYITGENLLLITKYRGMEPEVGGDYWGENGQQWAGVDRSIYPKAKIIQMGVNVSF